MWEGLRLWHKIDSLHKTPKMSAYFHLSGSVNPETGRTLFHATPKAAASCALFAAVLEDILTEERYMASMARLEFWMNQDLTGVNFSFLGFSEKLPLLIQSVFQTFTSIQVTSLSHLW